MESGRILRAGLITGAIVLAGAIYFLPKNQKQPESVKEVVAPPSTFSIDKYIADSRLKLPWDNNQKLEQLEQLQKNESANLALYDSIGHQWDLSQLPGISATVFQQKAVISNNEKDWLQAAYRYFDAYKGSSDSLATNYFVQQAITCYSKVIELNPGNLDAKTDLGTLYAEGTPEPMKGIMMLREVVTENPLHQNAQLNLGFLSMKSGQFDKAIERFNKVLEINPLRIDMYIYLGEANTRKGEKEEAIRNFKIFRNLTNDPEMIKNVDEYIAELESK